MGKRSREKKERREKKELKKTKEKPAIFEEVILKKIIFWGTCLILSTPLIVITNFFFPFVGPKSLYFMGLVQIIFFSWLFLIIFYPQYRPHLNPLLLALILFLVILILASILGVDPTYSFWSKFERMTGILMMLHLFAFFLVIFTVFQEKDWIKIFSISIFVALFINLIPLIYKMIYEKDSTIMRGGATIGNESFLGTYLLFNLFLALYLIFKSKNELKVYSFFSFLIIALILLFSGARAAKLSFLGGLILLSFLWLAFLAKKNYLKFLGRTLLVFSLLIFLISIFFIFQEGSILQQKFVEKATRARLVVWEGAWKGFLERPWLGWGPENFEYVFNKYFNPCMFLPECGGEIWFDRAHNIILDTLVNSGILGLLSYFLIFGAFFWILWRGYFGKKIDFWTSGIFSVMLVSYSVQNLTVFDMVSSYMIFFLTLGFVAHLNFQKKEIESQRKIPPKFLIIILLLILFIFSFFNFVIKPLKSDYYVIETLKAKNSQERLSLMQKALETSPVGKNQIRTFFFEQLKENFQNETTKGPLSKQSQTELEFLAKELEKSVKESPLDFRSYLRLGELYNILALTDSTKILEAEKILKKALEIFPTNQQTYWTLAQTKFYQGKKEETLSLVEKALSLEPRHSQSHLIVIQTAKLIGNEDLIKKKVEEALKIIPDLEPEIKKILKR